MAPLVITPSVSRFSLVCRSGPRSRPGALGHPESTPSRCAMQLAPILARIFAPEPFWLKPRALRALAPRSPWRVQPHGGAPE